MEEADNVNLNICILETKGKSDQTEGEKPVPGQNAKILRISNTAEQPKPT